MKQKPQRKNKTVLVAGGAGFIGSHLCDYLIAQGDRVLCIDNLITGSRKNIQHLLNHERCTFLEHDIIEPFFTSQQIDHIYNLACPASPPQYELNPVRTVKANTIGMINMLGLAKKHQARILQASTSEVYGDPLEHPQKESYRGNVNSIGPRACYDEGKRVAETLMFDYHRQHSLEIRVARIFNTYGPRMAPDDGRVVSNFITQAIAGKPLTIYGNGSQTRSFCYVSDMVDGLHKLMNIENFSGPCNLGNPQELTVKNIAERILAMTKSTSRIAFKKIPADDPRRRKPDISLAKRKLGWQPKIALSEGLEKTITYFKNLS